MKAFLSHCLPATALALSLAAGASTARADLEISGSITIRAEADFVAPLETHGEWIQVASYGKCWHPKRIAVEWRPYCEGHWVWTDCGWYWESDEPWAWACYHYGSWARDPGLGWIWVPGIEWAPAWVTWRVGAAYVGWAPTPPRGAIVTVTGPEFVFVETTRFQEPVRVKSVIVNNRTIINQTTVVNNVRRENRNVGGGSTQQVVVNEGPGLAPIQKAIGKQLKPVPIQEAVRRTPAPATLSTQPATTQKSAPTSTLTQPAGQQAPATPQPGSSKEKSSTAPAQQPKSTPDKKTPDQSQSPSKPAPSDTEKKSSPTPEHKTQQSEKKETPEKSTPPNLEKKTPSETPSRTPTPNPSPDKGSKPPGKDKEPR